MQSFNMMNKTDRRVCTEPPICDLFEAVNSEIQMFVDQGEGRLILEPVLY